MRNLFSRVSRASGMQVLSEQRVSPEILRDSHIHEARSVHTCDLQLLSPTGGEIWIDVRITSVRHVGEVTSQLRAAETQKLHEYGIKPSSHADIHGRLVPCIFESHGLMGAEALLLANHLVKAHERRLVADLGLSAYAAARDTIRALHQPLSVLLLRSAWHSYLLASGSVASVPPKDVRQGGID